MTPTRVRPGKKFDPVALMDAPPDPAAKPLEMPAEDPAAKSLGAEASSSVPAAPDSDGPAADDTPVVADTPAVAAAPAPKEPRVEPDLPALDLDALVRRVGAEVFERMRAAWDQASAALAQQAEGAIQASLAAAQRAAEDCRRAASDAGRGEAAIGYALVRKWAMPPVEDAGGDVILRFAPNPDEPASHEIQIGLNPRVVDFGIRVSIPAGYAADVTCDGVAGQRVVVATLVGSTHEHGTLKIPLRTNRQQQITVGGGAEVARLHLRRTVRALARPADF